MVHFSLSYCIQMYKLIANKIPQIIDFHLKLNTEYTFEDLISYFTACTLVF